MIKLMAIFPLTRLRRLRQTEQLRNLVSETNLSIEHFIYPLFISEEITKPQEILAMPGIMQWPLKNLEREARRIYDLGIPAVLLFGIPKVKDAVGTEAYKKTGIIQKSIETIKSCVPELLVVTDVCLCEYTDHGHCGIVDKRGFVQNDSSLELLSQMALSHAEAGADMVEPSDIMD